MKLISFFHLQNNRVGEVFTFIIVCIVAMHNGDVVKVHGHTCSALWNTKHGELEIVDTLEWCCEETYRKSEKQKMIKDCDSEVGFRRKQGPCSITR